MDDPQLFIVLVLCDIQFLGPGLSQYEPAGSDCLSIGRIFKLESQFAGRRTMDSPYPVRAATISIS